MRSDGPERCHPESARRHPMATRRESHAHFQTEDLGGTKMPADPRMLQVLSYYRDAELRGAALLMRLLNMTQDDSDAQFNLPKHVADETRHAWLWTKRIT